MPGRQRLAWSLRRPQQDSREPPGPGRQLGVPPGKEVSPSVARIQGIPRLPSKPGGRALSAIQSLPATTSRDPPPRWAPGAAPDPHRDRHGSALSGRRARPASRAHREPLAPPAAAAGRAESALRSPRVTAVAKLKAGGGPGYSEVVAANWASGPLPWGAGAEWERPQSGPCPRDPQLPLAGPDFVPLCSMQEKPWEFTRIKMPLARVTRDPAAGEAAELPDIVVSRSWVGDWMLQLQGLCAWECSCAGGEAEMQHF